MQRGASLEADLLEKARAGVGEEDKETYDLIVIGAYQEWFLKDLFFGSIPDRITNRVPCSVLLVKQYELTSISWVRQVWKRIRGDT